MTVAVCPYCPDGGECCEGSVWDDACCYELTPGEWRCDCLTDDDGGDLEPRGETGRQAPAGRIA